MVDPCVEPAANEPDEMSALRSEFAKARRKIDALERALQRQITSQSEREQRLVNVYAQSIADLREQNERLQAEMTPVAAPGAPEGATSVALERRRAKAFIEAWRAAAQQGSVIRPPGRSDAASDGEETENRLMQEIETLDRSVRDLQFKRARALIRDRSGNTGASDDVIKEQVRTEIDIIRSSGLFDEERYRAKVSDADDVIARYVAAGHDEAIDPHPLFAQRWYVTRYAKLLGGWLSPFAHFLAIGWRKGCDPHPLFAAEWYITQNADVRTAGENPFAHFVTRGHRENRDPNAVFDTAWYRDTYLQKSAADANPLIHYLLAGKRGTCEPSPWFHTNTLMSIHPRVRLRETNPLTYLLSLPPPEIDELVRRMRAEKLD